MENSNNNPGSQSRFLIAAVLSMVVLLGWTYFYAPKTPPANSNTNTNVATEQTAQPQPTAAVPVATSQTAPASQVNQVATTQVPENPQRQVTIRTPLYEVTLDSRGAAATSWIILRNKGPKGDFPVYADGSNAENEKPLQLIPQEQPEPTQLKELPFQLYTGVGPVDLLANTRNYEVSGAPESGRVDLSGQDSTTVEFVLRDQLAWTANGAVEPVEIRKVFTFRADSYVSDLKLTMLRNGQPVPNTRLVIGPSIGDHAINHHNLYHIEPEAVAAVAGDIKRHQGGYAFTYGADGTAQLADQGQVEWAGIADAYFAMVAIPSASVDGVEYRASKYDVNIQPVYDTIFKWVLRNPTSTETRHLVTAYIPIATDGSTNKIFTGTKDYFLLNDLSSSLTKETGRSIELQNLINFSNYWWLRWLTRPLSIPILYALNFFNTLLHNYGIAIIIFTFLFYSLLFPLRWSQSKSFKKASGNAPKMKEIQDKIKELQKKGIPLDDPRMRQLQMDQLKLTKDAIPLGGCLPMLLQFPLLIAFYTAVTVSMEVRQASFMWLPDLSAGDPWHLLEFAFAISMVLSMKFTPTTATVTPEQQMQQKMMTYFMPVMMLWVMWSAPSGLLLYWFFGNIVSFGQQMVINRMNKTNTPGAPEVVDTVPKNAKKVKPKLSTS